jgi:spore germination protein YaaH
MSNQFKFAGTIKVIGQTVMVSEKFSKREFVVTDTSSQYPQDVSFQVTQDKCSLLDSFMEGQAVEVAFNLRGREWTSPQGEVKYFNTLEVWRIEGAPANGTAQTMSVPQSTTAPVATATTTTEEDGDLPF